jgi:hypothetical protein
MPPAARNFEPLAIFEHAILRYLLAGKLSPEYWIPPVYHIDVASVEI